MHVYHSMTDNKLKKNTKLSKKNAMNDKLKKNAMNATAMHLGMAQHQLGETNPETKTGATPTNMVKTTRYDPASTKGNGTVSKTAMQQGTNSKATTMPKTEVPIGNVKIGTIPPNAGTSVAHHPTFGTTINQTAKANGTTTTSESKNHGSATHHLHQKHDQKHASHLSIQIVEAAKHANMAKNLNFKNESR